MTEIDNRTIGIVKKSPKQLKKDRDILYLYKNYVFNERVKDLIVLRYDLNTKEKNEIEESAYFNIYPDIPKKLPFRKCFKYRKAIENFIIYQYSKYADTFVERKILKETKVDVLCIYRKQQYRYLYSFAFLSCLFLRSVSGILFVMFMSSIAYKFDTVGNLIFLLNLNDILMKYQINTYFNLGSETNEFINYLETDRDEKIVTFKNKSKDNYDKFFVKDILDIKFEKGDKLVDYLNAENIAVDFHTQYLTKLETQHKENNKNLNKYL